MKKILASFLFFVLVVASSTAVTMTINSVDEAGDTDFKENIENDFYIADSEYYDFDSKDVSVESDCKSCDFQKEIIDFDCDNCGFYTEGGNFVLNVLPDKTDEQLALMDDNPMPTMSSSDLPSQFSWRNHMGGDWTTPARDQGSCGSCWAFSAIGAMEAGINIASWYPTTNIDLSEQYILSCLSAAGSCSGGWPSSAIQYIKSTSSGNTGNSVNGVPIESCMSYQASHHIPCSDKCDDWDYVDLSSDGVLWEVENFGVTSGNTNSPDYWDLLKSWVYTYGPLSVDMYASSGWNAFWSNNNNPNSVYEGTESGVTNHAVTLVGWKDDVTVKDGGYWIVKNSWGTGWGYNGFYNCAYGSLRHGDRDVVWVTTPEWPQQPEGPGPGDHDFQVFAGFSYTPLYGRLGEAMQFNDESQGPVVLREWDFTGDGEIDSTAKRPSWIYTKEGDYEVTLTVWSTYGYSNSVTYVVGVRDAWPPIAISNPEYYGGKNQKVTFNAQESWDPDGVIASYEWDFGDGNTAEGKMVTHTYPEQNGEYTAILTVTDNEGLKGNCEVEVKIDISQPPVTVANVGGLNQDETQWFNGDVRVSFTATDWTGVRWIYYRVDNGEWNKDFFALGERECTSKQITVRGHGIHNLEYYSIDVYENTENIKTSEVKIDTGAPTAEITFSGEKYNDWFIHPIEVTINANDEESGIHKIRYNYLGYWQEYTGKFTVLTNIGGGYVFYYQAEDKAGNIFNAQETIYITSGPNPPTITGPSSISAGEEHEFSFVSTHPMQRQVSYFVDWGDGTASGWTDFVDPGEVITISNTWDERDSYGIRAKARDEFGAESDWSTRSLTVSRTKNNWNLFPNSPFIRFIQDISEIFPIFKNSFFFLSFR